MPKEEWGTKRVCPTTGKRFYDLNANPIVSPYTGDIVTIEAGKARTMVADAEDAQTKKLKAADSDDEIALEDDTEESDANLGDDVLEDDDEESTVSLDELADVSDNDNED